MSDEMTKRRWRTLMSSMGLSESLDSYESLVSAYDESHRFYHTTKHIDAMLGHLDGSLHLTDNPYEIELAIWFHDAIYNPFSSKNELNSALWCRRFLTFENYPDEGIARIESMIMATLHNGKVKSDDEALLVDIDLSILGTPAHIYDEFEQNVRKEYKWIPSFVFRRNRKKLLASFIANGDIYHTEEFKNKFEALARNNITRAISNLG